MTPGEPYPIEIDVQELARLRSGNEAFLLVDCREPHEHQLVRIEGSHLIPMRETPSRLDELAAHRDGRIVVHCHHGGRSMRVVQFLREQGFAGAQNLAGGIHAWATEVDRTLPTY